ncbi:MAG: hypothetical protein E7404_01450 [Ruminococcaceae bacterium]|nr:hypothetical protein [Oscillospiraceae bacterium]
MKDKDKILHICLLCAFAFQLIFMLMDISDYGFLTGSIMTFADLLILARLVVFVPLCIYEAFKIYKCVMEEKAKEKQKSRHHSSHHHSSHHHSSHHHSGHHHTEFMDTDALLKKQKENNTKN